MKTKFTILLIILVLTGQAQKIELATGMAFPDTFNFGVRAITQNSAFGLTYGFLPGYNESLRTFGLDAAVLYGKNFKKIESKRSQFRFSLMFYREETERYIFKNTFLVARAGSNFLFTKNWGLGFEYGLVFNVAESKERKSGVTQSFFDLAIESAILPSLGVRTFYRL